MALDIHLLSIIVLLISGGLSIYVMKRGASRSVTIALIALSLVSVSIYFHFFRLYKIWPGGVPKKVLLHWHEVFHYYLGSKYFDELKYTGLYDAVLLADQESTHPSVSVTFIKDLEYLPHLISVPDAKLRALKKYRPNFTEARWNEFKEDLEYMKSIARLPEWLDLILYDAGFNPPPTWTMIGSTIAGAIPITSKWFAPAMEQVEILAWFDIVMFLVAFFFLARTFGIPALAVFVIVLGTSYIVDFSYNFGAFLRYIWFLGLVLSLCMLKQQKYFWSGGFMAFSVMDRIFPAFFAAGILISLSYAIRRDRSFLPRLRNFCAGLIGFGLLLFILSLFIFGFQAWEDFFQRIVHHSRIFFTNHIGYKKIPTFDDWVYGQNFWWAEGTTRFIEWNERLNHRWNEIRSYHLPLLIAVFIASVWNARKLRPEEAALHVGTICLFFFTVTANYYYIFLGLIPAILVRKNTRWGDFFVVAAFFGGWILLRCIPYLAQDYIIQNYLICSVLFLVLLCWLITRLIGSLRPAA